MAFQEKVVLITGASLGIGAETAKHFAGLGAKLALVGRNSVKELAEVVAECEKSTEVLSILGDVTIGKKCVWGKVYMFDFFVAYVLIESDNEAIIAKTIERFGQLDVLVNNAGAGRGGSIEKTTLVDFDFVINTNLRSVFQLTSLAVPHLLNTKGNVVNVSSLAGIQASVKYLPYSIAKAALDQFTKCVALELAPKGVRVNSVNPAVIATSIYKNLGIDAATYAKYLEQANTRHALGRTGTSSEVANAIAFLADNTAASFITGTLLAVDGGRALMSPT